MEVLPLKGYLRRHWWILILIVVIAWAIPRWLVPRPADILFFLIFLYLMLDRLQAYENKIQAAYQIYSAAVYKAEKVTSDMLKSLDELQTVGLLVTLREPLLEHVAAHYETIPETQFRVLQKHLREINLSIKNEKAVEILKKCHDIAHAHDPKSESFYPLLSLLGKSYRLAVNGHHQFRDELRIDATFITERLVADNKKLSLPIFDEVQHLVQATINEFLLKKQMNVTEAGKLLASLKLQISQSMLDEVQEAQARVEKYLG